MDQERASEADINQMGRSIFVFSRDHRDALSERLSRSGWSAVAARRSEGLTERFLGSDAQILMFDARGWGEAAVELAGQCARATGHVGGKSILLLEQEDRDALSACARVGIDQFLLLPCSAEIWDAALAFAQAAVGRSTGQVSDDGVAHALGESGRLAWRYDLKRREMRLSPALARLADAETVRGALRPLRREVRRLILRYARHVGATGFATAFAHHLKGREERFAHRIRREGSRLVGELERLPMLDGRENPSVLADREGARAWLAARMGEGEAPLALLIGLTRFEAINTAYGMAAGNALLARAARRIEQVVRGEAKGSHVLARTSGTEFLVGLAGSEDISRADALAQSLLNAVNQPFAAGDHLIHLGARVGVARARPGQDAQALLHAAGVALADARASDAIFVQVQPSSSDAAVPPDELSLESDLRFALERGEVEILYQPQFRCGGEDVLSGVEALVRWNHPAHGPLGAAALLNAATRSDYLVPLSAHIRSLALHEAAGWTGRAARLRLSLNITAADLAQPDFVARVMEDLTASHFPAERLTLEITESGLIENIMVTRRHLEALREKGIRIALDDFGTGYSSLSYLAALPLDYLKLDSGLGQAISGSDRERIIVEGIIAMAHRLGLGVIVEGVEREEQRARLSTLGCHAYQGFLRAPPLNGAALLALVEGI